jgi:hypothetical protein
MDNQVRFKLTSGLVIKSNEHGLYECDECLQDHVTLTETGSTCAWCKLEHASADDWAKGAIHEKIAPLVSGKRYSVELFDCCVEGDLRGAFVEYDTENDLVVFDFGTIGPKWGKWEAKQIDD